MILNLFLCPCKDLKIRVYAAVTPAAGWFPPKRSQTKTQKSNSAAVCFLNLTLLLSWSSWGGYFWKSCSGFRVSWTLWKLEVCATCIRDTGLEMFDLLTARTENKEMLSQICRTRSELRPVGTFCLPKRSNCLCFFKKLFLRGSFWLPNLSCHFCQIAVSLLRHIAKNNRY